MRRPITEFEFFLYIVCDRIVLIDIPNGLSASARPSDGRGKSSGGGEGETRMDGLFHCTLAGQDAYDRGGRLLIK